MKLSKHEYIISAITFCFIISLIISTIFPADKTHVVINPQSNAVPYYIDINTATEEELCTLDEIGPKLAKAIITQRMRLGGFINIHQVKTTPGVDTEVFNKIKNYIKV